MIAVPPPRVRIVLFERLADDLHEVSTLLARVACTVNAECVGPIVVLREPDRRLIVAMPFHYWEHVDPHAAQIAITCKVERYIRFLIREDKRDA